MDILKFLPSLHIFSEGAKMPAGIPLSVPVYSAALALGLCVITGEFR
jgi:hypothetical protein